MLAEHGAAVVVVQHVSGQGSLQGVGVLLLLLFLLVGLLVLGGHGGLGSLSILLDWLRCLGGLAAALYTNR